MASALFVFGNSKTNILEKASIPMQKNDNPQMQKNDSAQYIRMTTEPVGPLILSLAVPSMVSTLITSIYNLADTFFVGQIDTSATAAVGVVFSVAMVLNALGFWVGTGGSTLVSNLLGAKKHKEADTIASTAFFMSFGFGLAVAAIGYGGGDALLRLLGATDTILPYARDYLRFILIGGPFSASSLALSQCLRAEGLSRQSMYGQVAGGVLNMVLDPLFIFVFRWGITGAAAATALSQIIGWGLLLQYYVRGATQVHISPKNIARKAAEYWQLFSTGLPSLCRHCSNMLANIVLNNVAGGWGDAAIAAMSLSSRLLYLSNAVSNGLNQGSQPVLGYAHGKGDNARVKQAFWYVARISLVSMCLFAVFGISFAEPLVRLFRDDNEVVRIGAKAFRFICLTLPFANFANSVNIMFQMVKHPYRSSLLILGRQLIVYIPALLILPRLWGLTGLQLAGPAADLIVFAVALPMVLSYFRSLS